MPEETSPLSPIQPESKPRFRAMAPAWHTLVVILVLGAISAMGARSQSLGPGPSPSSHVAMYTGAIVWEWLMVAFIWFGLRLRQVHMRDLIGGHWPRWYSVLRDLGLAVLFLFLANLALGLLGQLLKAKPNSALRSIFPHGHLELALYLALTGTAGFCEEVIFRGYLQKQFAALTQNAWAGLILQGIAFGAAHGYQGWKYMLIIAVYGCFFGLLAYFCRSLRPGMMAHFLQDSVLGLLARHFMR